LIQEKTGKDPRACPYCKSGIMKIVAYSEFTKKEMIGDLKMLCAKRQNRAGSVTKKWSFFMRTVHMP